MMTDTRAWPICEHARILLSTLLLLGASALRPASADVHGGGGPPATQPYAPKLTGEPIQYLTKNFQDGIVDTSGRAWLLFRQHSLGADMRDKSFEHLVCPELPEKVLEFPATNTLLGFDRKGRFWEVTRFGLGWTDVATGEFNERRPAPGIDPAKLNKPGPGVGPFTPGFMRVMLEHSSGRLYFMDSYGLHVLDGAKWSYQLFDPAPKEPVGRERNGWYSVRIVEGPDGQVFAWMNMNMASGLWRHDGKTWTRLGPVQEGVIPLAGGQAILGQSENMMLRIRRVGSQSPAAGQPDPLLTRWSSIKHVLTIPGGATLVEGYDPQRKRSMLALVSAGGDVAEMPVDVVLRREAMAFCRLTTMPDGRVVLPTQPLYTWDGRQLSPLFANPTAPSGRCLGVDRSGRVFLDTDNQEVFSGLTRLAVVAPERVLAAPSLPVQAFGFVQAATVDTTGRAWARFTDQKFVSRYVGRQWQHVPAPAGLPDRREDSPVGEPMAEFQPLARGAMVVTLYRQGACLLDGEKWSTYKSMQELVEGNATRLRELIDNRLQASGNRQLLGLDAGGRIWSVSDEAERMTIGSIVYDGKGFEKQPGMFLMSPDGKLCARSNWRVPGATLYDATVWPAAQVTALPDRSASPSPRAVFFDAAGRFITFDNFSGPLRRWDGKQWTSTAVRGTCRLADSAGRLWFTGGFSELTVVGQRGQVGRTYEHPVNFKTPIVEQSGGVFWAAASDGLMRLTVADRGGKPAVVIKQHYRDIVPQGYVNRMFIDADGGLWIVTDRLCRVALPE